MPQKTFFLPAQSIRRLLPELGGGIATDAIMVRGHPIARMERTKPNCAEDSGWTFTSETESQAELDDPRCSGVYSLNTIANYEPQLVEYMTYPEGSLIVRVPDGRFLVVRGPTKPPGMRFLAPGEPGPFRISRTMEVTLKSHLLRRTEDGMTVLWRPGLTLWVHAKAGDGSPKERLDAVLLEASRTRFDERRVERDGITLLSYRLDERIGFFKKKHVLHLFAAHPGEWLQIACNFDEPKDEAEARSIGESLRLLSS